MSLQWGVISSFLILETAITFLLALPIISSSSWRVVFQSGLIKTLGDYANYMLTVSFVLLGVVFADSVREILKYRHSGEDETSMVNNPNAVSLIHMKLFRAQRNFLIAGYSLFLCLVIWRLTKLISSEAKLKASEEAAIKQAKSASDTARRLMEEQTPAAKGDDKDDKDVKQELEEVKKFLQKAQEELKSREADLVAIKKQAESTNREYDRLSSEYQKLQQQVDEADSKKSS